MKQSHVISVAALMCTTSLAYGQSLGNPTPGSPHDTLNFHLKKTASGSVACEGSGHAAFVRYDETTGQVLPTDIYISMVDWEQLDMAEAAAEEPPSAT